MTVRGTIAKLNSKRMMAYPSGELGHAKNRAWTLAHHARSACLPG
jgi:hypothetical protein